MRTLSDKPEAFKTRSARTRLKIRTWIRLLVFRIGHSSLRAFECVSIEVLLVQNRLVMGSEAKRYSKLNLALYGKLSRLATRVWEPSYDYLSTNSTGRRFYRTAPVSPKFLARRTDSGTRRIGHR